MGALACIDKKVRKQKKSCGDKNGKIEGLIQTGIINNNENNSKKKIFIKMKMIKKKILFKQES